MAMIYVRTKAGRKAFYEGKLIPNDKFIPVTDDPYIRRLIDHWEDLEVQGGAEAKGKKTPAPTAPRSTTTPQPAAGLNPVTPKS